MLGLGAAAVPLSFQWVLIGSFWRGGTPGGARARCIIFTVCQPTLIHQSRRRKIERKND